MVHFFGSTNFLQLITRYLRHFLLQGNKIWHG